MAIKVSEKPTDLEQGLNMATIKKAVEAFIKKIKAGTDHPKNKKERMIE